MRLRFATIILLLAANATTSAAGYISNYSSWKQKSTQDRALYAMGLMDGQLLAVDGDNSDIARSQGLNLCAFDLRLTGSMIAEAITRHYHDHSDMWSMPPIVIFQQEIVLGACLQHINAERAKYGQEPWKK